MPSIFDPESAVVAAGVMLSLCCAPGSALRLPDFKSPEFTPRRPPEGARVTSGSDSELTGLTRQAFQLRSNQRYALHPVEAALQYHGASAEGSGASGDASVGFEQAEGIYRAGAQGLRLSEIPQLPQQLRELSRLSIVDRAGRRSLRTWGTDHGLVIDEAAFLQRWNEQGKPGGAEHQVFHDKTSNRWFKRLYHGVNSSTLGDYLARMRLHAVLFPESAYKLEGFTINPKSKDLAPVVSQALRLRPSISKHSSPSSRPGRRSRNG